MNTTKLTLFRLCFLVLFTVAGVHPAAGFEQFYLNFDELPEGAVLGDIQPYAELGITVHSTYGGIPTVFRPTTGTVTPPFALMNQASEEGEFAGNQDLVIEFEGFTSTFVRVYVGLAETVSADVNARLRAYRRVETADGTGTVLIAEDHRGIGHTAISPELPRELTVESPDGEIDLVVITYGLVGESEDIDSIARELIDSVLIRTHDGEAPPPITDTSAPVVEITSPEDLATISHGHLPVTGLIEEDTGLAEVTASVGGLSFPLVFSEFSPDYVFAGFVDLGDSAGAYPIEVSATDIFGNTGHDSLTINYLAEEYPPPPVPPPANLNFTGSGMEVTQAVQGWGMIGDTPAEIDNQTELITGKLTLVRLYGTVSNDDNVPVAEVECELSGTTAGGDSLPGSPISSENPVTFFPGETYLDQRQDGDKSCNFILPPAWTAPGTIHLRGRVNAWNSVTEAPGNYNTGNDVLLDVKFYDTYNDLCLVVYRIRSRQQGNVTPAWNECGDNLDLLRQTYPVPTDKIDVDYRGTYETDRVLSMRDTDNLAGLLDEFRELLGLYYDEPFSSRCSRSVFLGLTHSDVEHRGLTDGDLPVSLSVASTSSIPSWRHFFMVKTAHESGHALGLHHVDACAAAPPYEPYPQYQDPFGTNYLSPSMGDWGTRFSTAGAVSLYDPQSTADIMSYCRSGVWGDRWISVYTWRWLCDLFGLNSFSPLTFALDESPTAAAETDREAGVGQVPYFLVHGMLHPDKRVTLKPIWTARRAVGSSDEPGIGPYTIQLISRRGAVLFERHFLPRPLYDLESYAFIDEVVPAFEDVTTVRLIGPSPRSRAAIEAGPGVPRVRVLYPNGGQEWGSRGWQQIRWTARDPDRNDRLVFTVFYSIDDGNTWRVVAKDLRRQSARVQLEELPGCAGRCRVRVAASDGIHQGADVSDQAFSKGGLPPVVQILKPRSVAVLLYGRTTFLEGLVSDAEDREIPPEHMRWTSDRDGFLGSGLLVATSRLSLGLHVIRFEVEDGSGLQGADKVGVFVVPARGISPGSE